jgi:hypothetical protein
VGDPVAGWMGGSEALPWLFAALVFAILALGPNLEVNGRVVSGFPLPYALVQPTIVGDFIRHPNRFSIILSLPISVLAGLGLQTVLERWRSTGWRARGATLCLAVLILFEYSVAPVPTVPPPDSAFYQRLQQEEGEFAVADFPIHYGRDKYYLFVQTIHERPMIGGHVSRPPADVYAFVEGVPLLVAGQEGPPDPGGLEDISRQLEPLAEAGVRYVIVHKDRTDSDTVEAWRRWFGFRPVYEDEWILAYRTEPALGREFALAYELHKGLGLVQGTVIADVEPSAGLVEFSVLWGAAESQHDDWAVELALMDETGQRPHAAAFPLVDGWPTDEWPAGALGRGRYALQIDPQLPDGSYDVVLTLVRPDTGERAEGSVVVAILEMGSHLHTFIRPSMQFETDGVFGDTLTLLGYDLRQEDDALAITLHWQALRRTDVSYKLFVHLYDTQSGVLAAQVDVIPRDWTYPTTLWEAGEVVSDALHLPLGEVPAGTYRLVVGAYGADTGERLPVRGAEPPSDVLVLQEIVVP